MKILRILSTNIFHLLDVGCHDNIRDNGTDPLSFVTPVVNAFNFNPITTKEVIEALSQLNPKKGAWNRWHKY